MRGIMDLPTFIGAAGVRRSNCRYVPWARGAGAYAFWDTVSGECVYVGSTTRDIVGRVRQHVAQMCSYASPVKRALSGTDAVVEWIESSEPRVAEQAMMDSRHPQLNCSDAIAHERGTDARRT